ncbi:glycosyltransferase family 2 protein [Candidatus Thioglobus sp.]|jgi:polyisoprenyl-phosphate glycosyltransferase|nr:glycosyltransferase family 2 protein [Candidatus Thioglobus sp.]
MSNNINRKKVSIITPVFNEQENVYRYYRKMRTVIDKASQYDFEFIITDNNSSDDTYKRFQMIHEYDKRVKLYKLARNVGYQKSIFVGYSKATGDCAIEFDVDLQDPPELLLDFLKHWESGYKVIYGIRKHREEGFFITWIRKIFYRVVSKISDTETPVDAGDFMLLDKRILSELQKMNEQSPYLRGIIFRMGFRKIGVEYSRKARKLGSTKFSMGKMVSFAIDGITSQSVTPLKLATYFGLVVASSSLLLSLYFVLGKLLYDTNYPEGFTTTTVLILFSISLNAIFLGIIGEYIGRIFRQVKTDPIALIEDSKE